MDAFYMHLALDAAWQKQLFAYPNPSVGAVLLCEGKIVAIEAHGKSGDSHAEVLALLSGYEVLAKEKINFDKQNAHEAHVFLRTLPDGFFAKCSMYVTLEPCSHEGKTPSCASLLADLKLKSIFIATLDPVLKHSGGAKRLQDCSLHIEVGLLENEAKELLEPFEIWQKKAFVLFKLAQTTNGKITGGIISSLESRSHTHKLRAVADKLLIGGNTIRVDRPILDCRLTGDNPPDVAIYTAKDVDRSIPLFDVPNRDVCIVSNLDFLSEPSFVLVEGGEAMLEALSEHIDWLLIYQSPNVSSEKKSYNIDMRLKNLHHNTIGEDLILWSKRV